MIRSLKPLGAALLAALALSAASAAIASAQNGRLTSTGPVTLDVTEIAGEVNAGTAFGGKTECPGSIATGHKYNVTPHEPISSGAETITVTPHLNQENCAVIEGGTTHKMTVTMNGCDSVIHIGVTVEADRYQGTGDIVCPAGKSIIEDIYFAASNENIKVCEITIGPQSGLAGPTVTDNTNGTLSIHGTTTGISASKSGVCGSGTSTSVEAHVNALIQGTNPTTGTNTSISLSHL